MHIVVIALKQNYYICRLSNSSISFLIIPFWNSITQQREDIKILSSNFGDGKYREKYNARRNGNSNTAQTACSFFLKCTTTVGFSLGNVSNQPTKPPIIFTSTFVRHSLSSAILATRSNFRSFLPCSSLCTLIGSG